MKKIHIDEILAELYAEDVITFSEKRRFEYFEDNPKTVTSKTAMEMFLDDVIILSLDLNISKKCDRLIQILHHSSNTALQDLAVQFGKYIYS